MLRIIGIMAMAVDTRLNCPVPLNETEVVTLAHGGGGRRMNELIRDIILPHFANDQVANDHDGAIVDIGGGQLVMTTDSYVVSPQFFPGGNIGDLAVNGTINDIAMCGAKPLYMGCGLILEEGFPIAKLTRVLATMRVAADKAGVLLVTGDTKVVEHGKGDGIFINTSGVGTLLPGAQISPSNVIPGDSIIINGTVGDHGMTIMCQREGMQFVGDLASDTASVADEVAALIERFGEDIHCMRDMTRGGLTAVLNEIAQASNNAIEIDESAVPVSDAVHSACEILGLDPFAVANEGKFAIFAKPDQAQAIVDLLEATHPGSRPAIIGQVTGAKLPQVFVRGMLGTKRLLDQPAGEQLPRIC